MSIFSPNIKNAILQFRAGKMTKTGNLVTADPRSGIFALVQQPSGAVEVHWQPEGQASQEEVRVIVGSVKVDRVKKCKTGRVFVIDFGQDQLFYWLQERSEDRDEEYLKTLKKHIERPGQRSEGGQAAQGAGASASSIQMTTLQNILTNLGGQPGAAGSGGGQASPSPAAAASPTDSSTVDLQRLLLSNEVLEAIRRDPAFYMARVHEHLPPGTDASDDVVRHLRNPQVTATAAMLQAALSEPEGFREVSNAFGVNPPAGTPPVGSLSFLRGIDAEEKKEDQ